MEKNFKFLMQPSVSYRSINKSAIEYIIQKNTEVIEYAPKESEKEYFGETKTFTHVPKIGDINIRGRTLVFIPRWDLNLKLLIRHTRKKY